MVSLVVFQNSRVIESSAARTSRLEFSIKLRNDNRGWAFFLLYNTSFVDSYQNQQASPRGTTGPTWYYYFLTVQVVRNHVEISQRSMRSWIRCIADELNGRHGWMRWQRFQFPEDDGSTAVNPSADLRKTYTEVYSTCTHFDTTPPANPRSRCHRMRMAVALMQVAYGYRRSRTTVAVRAKW